MTAVGRTLGALLSLSLLLLSWYAWTNFKDLNNGLHRLHIVTGQRPSRAVRAPGQDENILVVGNTDRTTLTRAQQQELHVGSDVSLATDTMLIVHLPADGKKAYLISLPRDAYVNIPGYGMAKLNAAYVDGYVNTTGSLDAKRAAGANLLIQTVTNLTGLTIDHFVSVSLYGFVQISDAIGGVTINLCNSVDDTYAHDKAIGLSGGSGFKMSKGVHTIKGVTALEFVRQRENLPNGDIDRTARQRYFIIQAFHKIASVGVLLDPGRLHSLIDVIDQAVWVDQGLDLAQLAIQMSALVSNNIVSHSIPFSHFATENVGSVEIVDPAQVRRWVTNLLYPTPGTPQPRSTSTGSSGTVHPPSTHKSAKASCIN